MRWNDRMPFTISLRRGARVVAGRNVLGFGTKGPASRARDAGTLETWCGSRRTLPTDAGGAGQQRAPVVLGGLAALLMMLASESSRLRDID